MSLPPPELHDLMRLLDKSSQPLTRQAAPVNEFIDWATRTHRGILGFALDRHSPGSVGTQRGLEEFDHKARPRVSTRKAFAAMSTTYRPSHLSPNNFLAHVANERYRPGTASTHDLEARAFAATHFTQQGLHVAPDQVHMFSGGTKNVLDSLLHAVMTPDHGEDWLVAAAGFDPSWRHVPGMSGGSSVVITELNETILRHDWMYDEVPDCDTIVLYVPLVNSLTGEVLTQPCAHSIARAVLQYNKNRSTSGKPAFVFADDSGIDSYHNTDAIQPIGAITGADLGDTTLGRMQDWTLTVVTPGSTCGLQDSGISFAVTHNPKLREALSNRTSTGVPPIDGLTAAAALCLTPQQWIEQGNSDAVKNLDTLRQAITTINHNLGFEAITVDKRIAAGRHTALQLHPRLFPMPDDQTISSLRASPKGTHDWETLKAAQTLNDLFKWHYSDDDHHNERRLTLRVNLAVTPDELAEHIRRLDQCATTLASIYPD